MTLQRTLHCLRRSLNANCTRRHYSDSQLQWENWLASRDLQLVGTQPASRDGIRGWKLYLLGKQRQLTSVKLQLVRTQRLPIASLQLTKVRL